MVSKDSLSIFAVIAVIMTIAGTGIGEARTAPQGGRGGRMSRSAARRSNAARGPLTVDQLLYAPLMYLSLLLGANKDNTEISKETGIARDWKISPDGKVYTFYLRQGVKFHNGDDLTAEDVKFSLERAIGPNAISSLAGVFKRAIDHITVDDPYTVSFHLKEPKFSFLLDISSLVCSSR